MEREDIEGGLTNPKEQVKRSREKYEGEGRREDEQEEEDMTHLKWGLMKQRCEVEMRRQEQK